MKVALQLGLIPLSTTLDKVKWAKDQGVEGIELSVWDGGIAGMRRRADEMQGVLRVTSICGNCEAEAATSSFDFLDPDAGKRKKSIEGCKAVLKLAGELGAVGQIVPPIFGGCRMPDLSPYKTGAELQEELMVLIARELGAVAAANKTLFMLEPLNRYEQHYLRKQADGVRIIQKAKTKGVGLLSDFFHMHIEETSTPGTFAELGKYTDHIHMADNTRMEPGTGDIDYVPAFKALKKVGFKGYMAYECGISGATPEDKKNNLAKSIAFVKKCIAKA